MGRSFCVSMIGDSFLLRQRAVLHEAEQIAERLLFYKDRADFLIGGDGDFDHIAVSSVFYACARHPSACGRVDVVSAGGRREHLRVCRFARVFYPHCARSADNG